jgi:hypothetical protein
MCDTVPVLTYHTPPPISYQEQSEMPRARTLSSSGGTAVPATGLCTVGSDVIIRTARLLTHVTHRQHTAACRSAHPRARGAASARRVRRVALLGTRGYVTV